eukprot:g2192.t1
MFGGEHEGWQASNEGLVIIAVASLLALAIGIAGLCGSSEVHTFEWSRRGAAPTLILLPFWIMEHVYWGGDDSPFYKWWSPQLMPGGDTVSSQILMRCLLLMLLLGIWAPFFAMLAAAGFCLANTRRSFDPDCPTQHVGMLLLILSFTPCDASYSLSSYLRQKFPTSRSWLGDAGDHLWARSLFRLHVSLLYFFAAIFKSFWPKMPLDACRCSAAVAGRWKGMQKSPPTPSTRSRDNSSVRIASSTRRVMWSTKILRLRSGLLVQSLLWTVSSSIVQVSLDSSGKIEAFRPHSKRQKLLRREAANASLIHEDELEHYDLLILIPASLRRDRARLSAIRETWTRDIDTTTHFCARCRSNRTLKYLFLLGDEADPDSEEMQAADVVALPSSSAYDRLAEKDTDSWIFVDRLLNFAEEHDLFGARRAAQAGEVRRKGRPQGGGRNPDGVFTKLTGQETYPVYSPGCGYLLTRDLCNYISMLAPEEDDARSESEDENSRWHEGWDM